jgi:hypothetical protein
MTDEQIEKQARKDAEELLLMLLIKKDVEFRSDVGRFYVEGKSVSITTVRNYLNRIEERMEKRVDAMTDQLEAGVITVNQWSDGFKRIITSSHVLSAALALGSIKAAVNNADVQARIASELKYADKFASELEADQSKG